jgi:hypothetical protein
MSQNELLHKINTEGNYKLKYFLLNQYLKKFIILEESLSNDACFYFYYNNNNINWVHSSNMNSLVENSHIVYEVCMHDYVFSNYIIPRNSKHSQIIKTFLKQLNDE